MINKRYIINDFDYDQYIDDKNYFKYKEFYWGSSAQKFAQVTTYNKHLTDQLVNNILVPIREYVGFPMIITSGVRDINIFEAMVDRGYHPSKRTDHSYLDPKVNPFGVGAADFVVSWPNMRYKSNEHKRRMYDLFKWVYNNPVIDFSQVIYYTQWGSIHISNPVDKVFSPEFMHVLKRTKSRQALVSDNGSHYTYYDYSLRFDQVLNIF